MVLKIGKSNTRSYFALVVRARWASLRRDGLGVEDIFGDLFEAFVGYAFALIASEGMVGVFDEEVWTASDDLGVDVELEVDGGAEDGDLGVEIAGEGWLVFAARSVPELVEADEVFGAYLGPDTPDEGLCRARGWEWECGRGCKSRGCR